MPNVGLKPFGPDSLSSNVISQKIRRSPSILPTWGFLQSRLCLNSFFKKLLFFSPFYGWLRQQSLPPLNEVSLEFFWRYDSWLSGAYVSAVVGCESFSGKTPMQQHCGYNLELQPTNRWFPPSFLAPNPIYSLPSALLPKSRCWPFLERIWNSSFAIQQ